MNVLCVIPARAGSKRIKDKNLQQLDEGGGPHLINLAYISAVLSNICDAIVVSTDYHHRKLGEISGEYLCRPDHLCGPTSDIADVTAHALERMESKKGKEFDYIITLQPATPLRSGKLIKYMLETMIAARCQGAITAARVVPWNWRAENGQATNGWHPNPYPRSQDVKYHNLQEINTVQIASREAVMSGKRWSLPLLMVELPSWATLDIDTLEDLEEARALWPAMKSHFETIERWPFHVVHDINKKEFTFTVSNSEGHPFTLGTV